MPKFFEKEGECKYTTPDGHPFGTIPGGFEDGILVVGEATSPRVKEMSSTGARRVSGCGGWLIA